MNQNLSGHLHTSRPTFLFAVLLSEEGLQISDAEAVESVKNQNNRRHSRAQKELTDGAIKTLQKLLLPHLNRGVFEGRTEQICQSRGENFDPLTHAHISNQVQKTRRNKGYIYHLKARRTDS